MSVQVTAMHMSDGLVNAPTSVMFGALAIAAVAFCAWKARAELDERTVPLAGLVAAFIFAVQMINFPILPGVSGHLLGGAFAAILVGPYTGVLCIAIVLVVQSLLFADGGVTALGMNITNMALIGVAAGYSTAVALVRAGSTATPRTIRSRAGSRRIHLPRWSELFAHQWDSSSSMRSAGAAPTSLSTVAAYMLGTHVLIGIGEGLITAVTVMAVARSRPDLVYLLRRSRDRDGGARHERPR